MAADDRVWHPWLRVQRVLRVMLQERWNSEAWRQIKPEIANAMKERSRLRRAGWFN
jgi:hypothetical protein